MGLKSFLVQQGFIKDEPAEVKKPQAESGNTPAPAKPAPTPVEPTYFPVNAAPQTASAGADPSFVSPLQQQGGVSSFTSSLSDQPDPAFIKFFEDELAKQNLPGPDYFEFRQMLLKMQQRMSAKGMVAPEVVLQAVLTSFEAQEITPARLLQTAQHYKDAISAKKDEFIKGAEAEKNNQLQKRQAALQAHNDAIAKLQQQLQQLEVQKKQLEDALNKEKTQLDIDKSFGKEAIEKIEKAQRSISLAHDFMLGTVDADIKRLQSV